MKWNMKQTIICILASVIFVILEKYFFEQSIIGRIIYFGLLGITLNHYSSKNQFSN